MIGIVEPEVLVAAYASIAQRLGVAGRVSATAVRVALREADHHADDTFDVPAALLYALGRNPRCFDAFRAMSVLVIEWHVKTLGFRLDASRREIADVLGRVAIRDLGWEEVRSWVNDRLLPFAG